MSFMKRVESLRQREHDGLHVDMYPHQHASIYHLLQGHLKACMKAYIIIFKGLTLGETKTQLLPLICLRVSVRYVQTKLN